MPGDSRMHRLSPEAKLVAVVAFVVVIAMTPRRETVAFALYALGAWAIIATTKIGLLTYLKRLSVIIPFVMFALIVPFIGGGESVHVLGVSLSVDGLWATWNILAKAGLGATMSIALSATTPVPELLHGMTRLKVPRLLVAIVAFMLR
ncbi:MAG: energy-coupling factor transporter transmembrane component T, partial [Actinomycetota bacterium]|nr:energy-coupling factor transporter transmembrane component T [Actinomycetota bacterium]